MKKIITVFAMLCISMIMTACTPTIVDNSIELNLENYETYIETSARLFGDDGFYSSYGWWYPKVKGEVTVTAASTNYDYIDVIIRVRIVGNFTRVGHDSEPKKKYDETITVSLNIGGSGVGSKSITIADVYYSNYAKNIVGEGYEVISVSGKVKPLS